MISHAGNADPTSVGSAFLFWSKVLWTALIAIDSSSRMAHRGDNMAAEACWHLEGNKNSHFKIIIL